jgi:type II secretory pathway pseudopilin PulG
MTARRARRAFTLLELVLAMMMGTMVLLTVVTTFTALRRIDARTSAASDAAIYLARTHRAMASAFSTLVMAEARVTTLNVSNTSASQGSARGEGEARPENAAPQPAPRLKLEADPATGNQRLELLLVQPPILGARPLDGTPEPRGAVRGVFWLEQVRRPDGTAEEGRYNLIWSTLKPLRASADPSGRRETLGSVVLAENVAEFSCTLWRSAAAEGASSSAPNGRAGSGGGGAGGKGSEPKLEALRSLSVLEKGDLPAYAEVEVRMVSGQRQRWLFEVNWTLGPEPVIPEPLNGSGAGGEDKDGAGGGGGGGERQPGETGGSGGGGGSSDGRRAWDQDRALQEAQRRATEEARIRGQPR